ncbi:succinate dehydrogenase, hydrophobic membrane anchor protein [bacterium]|nr:succinate dehydrogenase, hydrophobic membrane anchor protein [bacterium]
MNLKQFGTGSGGSTSWIWQRITALILVVTLFLHYLFLHFLNGGVVTFEEVTLRLASPLYKTIDITFLTAALYHSVIGVTISIHDYVTAPMWRTALVGFAWVVGIVLWITGVMTVATVGIGG